jgi:hypothetical protein
MNRNKELSLWLGAFVVFLPCSCSEPQQLHNRVPEKNSKRTASEINLYGYSFTPQRSYSADPLKNLSTRRQRFQDAGLPSGHVVYKRLDEVRSSFLEYRRRIDALPPNEQAFHEYLDGNGDIFEGGWFALREIPNHGLRTVACRIQTDDVTSRPPVGKVGETVVTLKFLEHVLFTWHSKEGLDFAALGRLQNLKGLQPPIDTTDADLITMENLNQIEWLDLGRRKGIRGQFVQHLNDGCKLRVLNLWKTNFQDSNVNKLSRLKNLNDLTLPESIGQMK